MVKATTPNLASPEALVVVDIVLSFVLEPESALPQALTLPPSLGRVRVRRHRALLRKMHPELSLDALIREHG